jgi:hypothetical protein
VFATERLHPHGFDVSVGSHADWSKRSDHAPLVCEFHEQAQTNPIACGGVASLGGQGELL